MHTFNTLHECEMVVFIRNLKMCSVADLLRKRLQLLNLNLTSKAISVLVINTAQHRRDSAV